MHGGKNYQLQLMADNSMRQNNVKALFQAKDHQMKAPPNRESDAQNRSHTPSCRAWYPREA
jgi:hypothetical protein